MTAVHVMSLIVGGRWYLLIKPDTVRYVGIVIALAGATVFIKAIVTMKSSWRAGIDASQHTKLVRNGIYRVSRNPAFLGFELLYLIRSGVLQPGDTDFPDFLCYHATPSDPEGRKIPSFGFRQGIRKL